MRQRLRPILVALFVTSSLFIGASACDDKQRHGASASIALAPAASQPATDGSVASTVRAFLTAIEDAQEARKRGLTTTGRKDAYDRAMATIWSMAAKDQIHARAIQYRSATLPRDITPDAALTTVSESWVSLLAHYVHGFNLEYLTTTSSDSAATAYLEAESPADREVVRSLEQSSGPSDTTKVGLRPSAIARGVSIPTHVGIELTLVKTGGRWLVSRLQLVPARRLVPIAKPRT